MSFGFWLCKTNVQVLPIAVFGLIQTFSILSMEGESCTNKAEIERFLRICQLIMSDLTLVSGSEFEKFLSVECDWKNTISQKVPNLGFLKKRWVFFHKTFMISVSVEIFVI